MEWFHGLISAAIFIYLLYKFLTRNNNYWRSKGVKSTNPLPLLGDNAPVLLKRKNAMVFHTELYNRFKDSKFFGAFMFFQPCLFIRDPEMLKQMMVKDAEYFINRYNWNNSSDPFVSKNLSLLQDEQWRNLRTVMTTVFTGAKMKDMFKFMEKCAQQSVEYLSQKLKNQIDEKGLDANTLEMDVKEFFSRFGTDVIGSTAFGIEVDSFKNPNNEFYAIGSELMKTIKAFPVFKMLFMSYFPTIAKFLNISFFGEKINDFFTSIVSETIENREKHNIIRKDMIHILTEARKGRGFDNEGEIIKGKLPDLTDQDIASQAVSFFFGGFDIMATALSFICYEMAVNPDIQEKLYEDIEEVVEREDGLTYEGIMYHMHYLDMVVKEAMRKWPPVIMSDRQVSKTYVIPESEDSPELTLKRGDTIFIPIICLHRDANYFPDPEKFDPERFRDEKNTVKPFTYLPFGAGLRHCIALRYAMMEIKVGIASLLRKFEIVPTKRTDIPMKLSKNNGFMMQPENGFWMGLKRRA